MPTAPMSSSSWIIGAPPPMTMSSISLYQAVKQHRLIADDVPPFMGWKAEGSYRVGLVLRELRAQQRRSLHAIVAHEVARAIDHSSTDREALFLRRRYCVIDDVPSRFQSD